MLMLQSDTPTTPTSTGRGGGNNTRERDSGGRDNGKKKAQDIDPQFRSEHPPPGNY
jgi:hypothetical protein